MLKSFQFLFFVSIFMSGILLSFSSSSLFTAWIGMEMTTLCFISYLLITMSAISSAKYFLIQSTGSLCLVESILIGQESNLIFYLFLSSLLLKVGSAPLHFWYPSVMSSLSWNPVLILMTFQKIIPFYMISLTITLKSMIILGILNGFIGAIGGFNETCLRKILAFSSINHLGWIFLSMKMNNLFWIFYFVIYSISVAFLVLLLKQKETYYSSEILALSLKSEILLAFLSLGGFPPLLGFSAKWTMISCLSLEHPWTMLSMCMFSVITLYYYIRSSLNNFLVISTNNEIGSNQKYTNSNIIFGFMISLPIFWGLMNSLLL
uniref:NADH-ubiquinone oxidoreductase chain 2 n=1 Tax=Janira maculosa TaxID=155701 RepID=E3SXA8_9CRUS|nr:NADH dehydrogenase subunit 2 [Janira maculosa]